MSRKQTAGSISTLAAFCIQARSTLWVNTQRSQAPYTQCEQGRPCALFSTPTTLLTFIFTTPIFQCQLSRQDPSCFDEKILFIAEFLLRHLWQVFQLDVKKLFLSPANRLGSSCLTRWYSSGLPSKSACLQQICNFM